MKVFHQLRSLMLIALVFPFFLQAQAPGYLGKKFSLDLGSELNIVTWGLSKNGNTLDGYYPGVIPGEKGVLALNYSIKGQMDFALTRLNSLGLAFSAYTTGMSTNYNLSGRYIENFHHLKVKKIGLRYNWFKAKKGSLAPIGSFFYLGADVVLARGEIILREENDQEVEVPILMPDNLDQKLTAYNLVVGWSKRTMVFENFFLKTGFSFNVYIPKGGYADLLDIPSQSPEFLLNPAEGDWEFSAQNRIFGHDLVKIEVGIGAILF